MFLSLRGRRYICIPFLSYRYYTFFIMAMFLSLERKKRSILDRLCTSSTLRPSSRAACVVRSPFHPVTKNNEKEMINGKTSVSICLGPLKKGTCAVCSPTQKDKTTLHYTLLCTSYIARGELRTAGFEANGVSPINTHAAYWRVFSTRLHLNNKTCPVPTEKQSSHS